MVYTGFMGKPIRKPPDSYTGSLSDWKLLTAKQRSNKRADPVKKREQDRKSWLKRKTKKSAVHASWYAQNRESYNAKRTLERQLNKVEINKKEKQNYIDNKEKHLKQAAVYYKENTEKIKARRFIIRKANAQKDNAKLRARRVKKREALYEGIAVAIAASNNYFAQKA